MQKMWRWATLFLGLAFPALAAEPGRFALVIGNGAYPTLPAIPACTASASVVGAALRRAGFAVSELANASNGQMGAAVSQFGDTLAQAPGAQAVLYVCGYALGFDGRVFLLPSSARLERETDTLTQGLIARLLVTSVTSADLRGGLVLLDTVARPGASSVPLEAIAPNAKGLVAVNAKMAPSGTTVLASALAAELAASNVEVGAALRDIRTALQDAPGLDVLIQPPVTPAWLVGGAPAAPVAAAPVPTPSPPARPPEPAASAPLPPAAPEQPAPGVAGAPSAPAVLGDADRRSIQLALKRLGYYAGEVDGRFGLESVASVRRFQHELGAEMTGRLTNEQAARLYRDSR